MNRRIALLLAGAGALLLGAEFGSREYTIQLMRWNEFLASTAITERVRVFVSRPRNPFRGPERADSLNSQCLALIDSLGVRQRTMDHAYILGRLNGTVSLFPPDAPISNSDSALLAAPLPCGFGPLANRDFSADRREVAQAFSVGTGIGLLILVPLAFLLSYSSRGWQRVATVVGGAFGIAGPFVFDTTNSAEVVVLTAMAAFSAGAAFVIAVREAFSWVRRGFQQP